MIKIKWIKDSENGKMGEVGYTNKKSAKLYVDKGYAKYVEDIKKKTKKVKKKIDIKPQTKTQLQQAFIDCCVARREYYWIYTPKPFMQKNKDATPTALTDSIILQHIAGTKVLGLSPFVNDGEVLYGGMDFDVHGLTPKAKELKIKELGEKKYKEWEDKYLEEQRKQIEIDIPKLTKWLDKNKYIYFINSSGSEGRHLRVYSNKPTNAKVMRYFLINLQEQLLGEVKTEIFPKQDVLNEQTEDGIIRPYGNQMKAVLAIHPRTKKLAGIIKNKKVLDREESLKFLYEFSQKIPKANTIEFDIPPELEEKHRKKKFTGEYKKSGEFKVPGYCRFFENVACVEPLPSGKANRHDYLDGNAYQYLQDKQNLLKDYMEIQGRDHTAFNDSKKWVFSCQVIHKYLRENTGEGIERGKNCCDNCPLFSSEYMPDMQPLIEHRHNKQKREGIIKDILKSKINSSHLEFEDVINELMLLVTYKESTLIQTFEEIKKDTIDEEINKRKQMFKEIDEKKEIEIEKQKGTTAVEIWKIGKQVLEALVDKKRGKATEILVEYILDNNYIYSTRDDENSEMWIYSKGIYIPQGKTFVREICREILGNAFTTAIGNQVIDKLQVDSYIDQEEFFVNDNIEEVAVLNGVLNIFTRKLRDFDPNTIFFSKLPIKYQLDKDCKTIQKFFKTIQKSNEDVLVMQEIFGYLLYRKYSIEKAIMLCGNGRNGKSKTQELMKRFIGAENCSNIEIQEFETDPFALGELFNMSANLAGDISPKALKTTSKFKTLTGGDTINAPRKFKTRVKFVNYAKQLFSANELPITYDLTPAFWNRWVLLDFPYTFISQKEFNKLNEDDRKNIMIADVKIIDKLSTEEELSGLLNWSLDGLKRLLEQKDFSYSKSVSEVKDMWLRKSSSFLAFCMDNLESDYDCKILKSELRKAYTIYCRQYKLRINGDKEIKHILETTYGASAERSSYDNQQVYAWEGVKFSQGSQGCYGFSFTKEKVKKGIESENPSKPNYLN